jgi:hypothetical protein
MASVYDDIYRLGTAQALAVASVGGAAVSTSIFGTQTHAIAMSFPGSTSSTGGERVKVIDVGGAAVSSTTDFLLPAKWVEKIIVNPGQRLSAISNDAGTPSVSVVEPTK